VETKGFVGFVGEVEVVPEETLGEELVNVVTILLDTENLPCRRFRQ